MTLTASFDSLRCLPEKRATRFLHEQETATPAYYSVTLPDEHLQAELTGRSRSAIFRFTYQKAGKAYLIVNPNSDEGEGYIEIDTLQKRIYGYNPVHRIYQAGENLPDTAVILSLTIKRNLANSGLSVKTVYSRDKLKLRKKKTSVYI